MAGAQKVQRRIKDTVIFDNRIKRHFVKDKATLAVYVHLNENYTGFVNTVASKLVSW